MRNLANDRRGKTRFPALFLYLISAAIGLAVAARIFTPQVLLGTGSFWDSPNYPDMQQHMSAANYYLADAWRFPIFLCKLILPPDGISIVFLDANPLLAFFDKLLFTATGMGINYFGPWIAISYALQCVAFLFLCRSLGLRGLVPTIACAVIAVSIPEFVHRYFHLNLLGQFFITTALALYFQGTRLERYRAAAGWGMALTLLSLLVHFYLFAMVAPIYAVTLLEAARHSPTMRRMALRQGVIFLAGAAVTFISAGYLRGTGYASGFGYFSMNLLSPFVPQRSGLFPAMSDIVDATGGQYEGFNYLGAGVISLTVISLWFYRLSLWPLVKRHRYLVVLMLAFTAFAVSFEPWLGDLSLRHPSASAHVADMASGMTAAKTVGHAADAAPKDLAAKVKAIILYPMQQLRSSGRFFWPVGYLIAGLAIAGVAARLPKWSGCAIIAAAAVLQFIDATPLRAKAEHEFRSASTAPLPPQPWERIIAAHGSLRVLPSMDCADTESPYITLLAFYASTSATPTYSAKLSRGPLADCPTELGVPNLAALPEDQILFLLSPPIPAEIVQSIPDAASLCRPFKGGFVCTRKWAELDARGLGSGGS